MNLRRLPAIVAALVLALAFTLVAAPAANPRRLQRSIAPAATSAATVTITSSDTVAAETSSGNANTALFTLARTGATTSTLTVLVAYGGTAVNGTDYATMATSLQIPAGQISSTLSITPIDDALVEGMETITVTVRPSANYTVGSPSSVIITLNDNDSATPVTTSNIVFATHTVGAGTQDVLLNVYLPSSGTGPWPVILFYPGGAWQTQNQTTGIPPLLLNFTAQGYAVVSANYIPSTQAIWPAQIQDGKAAVRWVRANAAAYHFDPNRIGVCGHSSGAHIAAYVALTGGVKTARVGSQLVDLVGTVGGNFSQGDSVLCCAPMCGSHDLLQTDHYFTSGLPDHDGPTAPESILIGAPIQTVPELTATAHPILHVKSGAVPFWIAHGTADTLVPFNESELLNQALVRAGATSTFWPVQGGGHVAGVLDKPETFFLLRLFFDRNLRGVATPASPVPSFTLSASSGVAPLLVNFDGSASASPSGLIVSYSWANGEDNGQSGATMTRTYTKPGVYPVTLCVYDDKGGSASVTQFVTVTPATSGGANAPAISLTAPVGGYLAAKPGNLVATASATAAGAATISNVEFFLNGQPLAWDTVAPYAATLGSLAPGSYQLTARASDSNGVSTTTAAVSFRVLSPTDAELRAFISAGQSGFTYNFFNDTNVSYTTQRTTDFSSWTTFTPGESVLQDFGGVQIRQLTDPLPISGVPRRFMRLNITTVP